LYAFLLARVAGLAEFFFVPEFLRALLRAELLGIIYREQI
jgi:hypothetical protein